jgi:hypothetical protein
MTQRDYHVQCECGTTIPVSTGQAGSTVSCECGSPVSVPRLAQLRQMAGKDPYAVNAVQAIRRALNLGELPGTDCACCHGRARRIVRCRVVCERSYRVREGGEQGGNFAAFLLLGVVSLLGSWSSRSYVETRGRDTEVELAVAICHGCRSVGSLHRKRARKRLLKKVPLYANLFAEYRGAALHDISIDEVS